MNPIILQLFTIFAPIVKDVIERHRAAHNGETPTLEQMTAEFHGNIDRYLAEGQAWRDAHPEVQPPPGP